MPGEAVVALRDRLAAVGFDEDGVVRTLGDGLLAHDDALRALRLRADADEPLPLLVRLFHGGETVERGAAARALDPAPLTGLEDAGVLEAGAGARALVRLDPLDGLVLASDRDDPPLAADHVIRVGPATRTLAALTVRFPVETALDLGCGSGAHALLAARHARRVVGTDLNPRALRFARLNATLNGVDGIEWLEGDLAEPVRGRRFDLVTANPPFVVSPDHALVYRDSGLGGDEISRRVLEEIPGLLADGGLAHVLCCWVREPGADWSERPRRWLEGSGCDAWILRFVEDDAWTYAVRWTTTRGVGAVAAARWVDAYRTLGIERLVTAAVVLRRRDGANWTRADDMSLGFRGSAGAHVLRVFAAQDLLATGDEAFLDARLAPAPGTSLLVRSREGAVEHARIAVDEGLRLGGRFPVEALALVERLDGTTALREAVRETSAPASAVDAVRELVAKGLLVPR